MSEKIRIGIIICGRYQTCAGGKCFRALRERKGAFEAYAGSNVEVVGFTTCGGSTMVMPEGIVGAAGRGALAK